MSRFDRAFDDHAAELHGHEHPTPGQGPAAAALAPILIVIVYMCYAGIFGWWPLG